jgi:hypothetical protein
MKPIGFNPEDGPTKKKKAAVPAKLSHPINLLEQEKKFFESGCKINPQFEYDDPDGAERFLA